MAKVCLLWSGYEIGIYVSRKKNEPNTVHMGLYKWVIKSDSHIEMVGICNRIPM